MSEIAPHDDEPDGELAITLIEGSTELAGAAAGAAVGLIGGPVGAFAGAGAGVVMTRVLKRVGADIQRRLLGPRQRIRIGAAFAFAVDEIAERLAAGETPRSDWARGEDDRRPEAEEILEGVLLGR